MNIWLTLDSRMKTNVSSRAIAVSVIDARVQHVNTVTFGRRPNIEPNLFLGLEGPVLLNNTARALVKTENLKRTRRQLVFHCCVISSYRRTVSFAWCHLAAER